jgi:hypothetical protein
MGDGSGARPAAAVVVAAGLALPVGLAVPAFLFVMTGAAVLAPVLVSARFVPAGTFFRLVSPFFVLAALLVSPFFVLAEPGFDFLPMGYIFSGEIKAAEGSRGAENREQPCAHLIQTFFDHSSSKSCEEMRAISCIFAYLDGSVQPPQRSDSGAAPGSGRQPLRLVANAAPKNSRAVSFSATRCKSKLGIGDSLMQGVKFLTTQASSAGKNRRRAAPPHAGLTGGLLPARRLGRIDEVALRRRRAGE